MAHGPWQTENSPRANKINRSSVATPMVAVAGGDAAANQDR